MQEIHESVFIAEGARLFGRVEIGEGASVWYNAVVRCECQHVRIGRYTNLQDFAMVHVGFDHPTVIGDFCSITHHATIHGATIGDACLVGINATIMDGAVIGAGSIVGGGAFVTEGSEFPPHSIILGAPARAVKQRDSTHANRLNAWVYHRNAQAYARGDHRAWEGEEYERWRKQKLAEIRTDADL